MEKIHILLLTIVFCIIGCKGTKDAVVIKGKMLSRNTEVRDNVQRMEVNPETIRIANNLWDYIKQENYKENWNIWPGKKPLYKAIEVKQHKSLLTTYINNIGYEAILKKKGLMPNGTIIITENYINNKTLASIDVMFKKEGFNPEVNDWFWVKYGTEDNVKDFETINSDLKVAGKVTSCIDCHRKKIGNDCLFAAKLSMKYIY